MAPILLANLVLKLLTHFTANAFYHSSVTITTGLVLLYHHFRDDHKLFFLLLIYISSATLLTASLSSHKTIVWFVCFGFVCLNECLVVSNESFLRLRSHIMLLVMKVISLNAFVSDRSKKEDPDGHRSTALSSLTYLLHPLSLLLGVWHPIHSQTRTTSLLISLFHCLYHLMVATVFLLLSTCLIHYYIGQKLLPVIVSRVAIFTPMPFVYFLETCLTVYITAQQFRFSHYFICFATQSMLCLWDFESVPIPMTFPN